MLMVFNKMDMYRDNNFDELLDNQTRMEVEAELEENIRNKYGYPCVFMSATNKENVEELREILSNMIKEQYVIRYPHQAKQW
jgi:GTPase